MSEKDDQFGVSFGLIISVKKSDVDKIRAALAASGVEFKLIFETVSPRDLYLLREYQVSRVLQGDLSQLRDLHNRKEVVKSGDKKTRP
jgi:hypothetical protein